MFMMMLGDKFLLEHISSQFIMLNIIAEGLEIEISTDKLNTIYLSMSKFPAGIGLGLMKPDVDSRSLTFFHVTQTLHRLDFQQDTRTLQP